LADLFPRYKALADTKREVTDFDLQALMSEQHRFSETDQQYRFEGVRVEAGDMVTPSATVSVGLPNGESKTVTAQGTGPVDAVCKAVDQIVEQECNLREFAVASVTDGIDAIGEVTIRVEDTEGHIYAGRGGDTDIIVASAKAYINAINRMGVLGPDQTNITFTE
jgi:2-isopropylmalate synthase